MRLLGGGLPPGDLAVAAGAELAAGEDELKEPEIGVLLPEDEAADFCVPSSGDRFLVSHAEL